MLPKGKYEFWKSEPEKGKRQSRPWPMLIWRLGDGHHPAMARIVAFFNERGFAVELEDDRFERLTPRRRNYKLVLIVGDDKEAVLKAESARGGKMSAFNRIFFSDEELIEFVLKAEAVHARIQVVAGLLWHKLDERATATDIIWSNRSKWLLKEFERVVGAWRRDHDEWNAFYRDMADQLQEQELRERVCKVTAYAVYGFFVLAVFLWIYFVRHISFDGVAAVVIVMAALNLLRDVPEEPALEEDEWA